MYIVTMSGSNLFGFYVVWLLSVYAIDLPWTAAIGFLTFALGAMRCAGIVIMLSKASVVKKKAS
jgi:hypothetical protein